MPADSLGPCNLFAPLQKASAPAQFESNAENENEFETKEFEVEIDNPITRADSFESAEDSASNAHCFEYPNSIHI